MYEDDQLQFYSNLDDKTAQNSQMHTKSMLNTGSLNTGILNTGMLNTGKLTVPDNMTEDCMFLLFFTIVSQKDA